jgi:hypothetical protein
MGIITPVAKHIHTFGIFGSEDPTSVSGSNLMNGYLENTAEMIDATSTTKYTIVSVWANNYMANAPANGIKFDFTSSAWDSNI